MCSSSRRSDVQPDAGGAVLSPFDRITPRWVPPAIPVPPWAPSGRTSAGSPGGWTLRWRWRGWAELGVGRRGVGRASSGRASMSPASARSRIARATIALAFTESVAEQVGERGRAFQRPHVVRRRRHGAGAPARRRGPHPAGRRRRCRRRRSAHAPRSSGIRRRSRTHGVHAEPTTFGLKLLGWLSSCAAGARGSRCRARRRPHLSAAPMPTPIPGVEESALRALGLDREPWRPGRRP